MKKILLLSLLTFLTHYSYCQSTPESIVAEFFKEYPKGPAKAVETLYATNPWSTRNRDGIEQIKSEVNKLTLDYVGKYHGYEPITKRHAGNSFALHSYLVRYDRQPLRFTFEFYKADDKWIVYAFKFDSNIDDELEESAKLNYFSSEPK
ncbi:hypothetical protein [Hymenobacter nivis]|uniref:DUF4019 domain-containing protein n=1 Tax=Hymenobacter nivis TaxID=1850093 RepID=A0A502GZH5_9BACT|nr:hypothetical protein [Hymenobacter nivis]TPG66658.1 hypothetical protein EAH73_09725 [Hymenobacter nivis]